ncbi:MAG: hypothetical protein M8860_11920 [marine benthic group bacterium]|nr:hypothetical protein [Gemmatimonadota bacterium]MCL7963540.1 hypothetical protein [Candidatus Carthagonibacter metallireducens]MCL7937217.1 hypothetical protein [Gemmatimonadota bacterium]MCL7958066.1 hypothetical protein [Gemmatimonadota bacterium]MCL7964338.1 hypothetical protein [Gemmatimonadota bacterium]
MPGMTRNRLLLAALLLGIGCAGSRESGEGTDPGASGSPSTGSAGAVVGTASLESELYRLMVSQGAYFEETGTYARDLESLDFKPGAGVGLDLIEGGRDGFSAVARSGDAECAVYSGQVRSPRGYLSLPDRPACRD